MPNSIATAAIYQSELDRAFEQSALTGWMEANTSNAKYSGGAEVKIPSINLQGLGDYSRGEGAPDGNITLKFETMKMTQDRGRGFNLDEMDVDESNFSATIGNVMGEFQKNYVVPEVDAYRLSKLYKLADTRKRTYTPAEKTVLSELQKDILEVQDKVGSGVPLVIHISTAAYGVLLNADKITRYINLVDFKKGEVAQKIKALDGIPLIVTPNRLMMSEYDFMDGKTSSQEDGGFKAKSDAKQINWLICARTAPISPCKQDKVRIFTPEQWQKSRSWHADYRRFYDLWVTEKKLGGIYVNIGA